MDQQPNPWQSPPPRPPQWQIDLVRGMAWFALSVVAWIAVLVLLALAAAGLDCLRS